MKLNKMMKLVVAILLISLISVFVAQFAFAIDIDKGDLSAIYTGKNDASGASNAVQNVLGMIINVIRVVAAGVAIIMLVVLGIQYVTAAPEGKAEIKKNATIYVIGAVILFAASGVLSIIRKFAIESVGDKNFKTIT